MSFRDYLAARLFTPKTLPVSPHTAAPRASRLGASPFARAEAPVAAPPPEDWSRDPESGAPLPFGPGVVALPGELVGARQAHRHGWFPAEVAAGRAREAAAALAAWARQDLPGQGVAWAHPSDLAARLVHWHVGLAWADGAVSTELRDALAGSAAWHLDHLRARLPLGEADGLRRVVHFAGMVVGGLTFPDLDGARAAWSEGLAGLRWHLPVEIRGDGCPVDPAPRALAEALWLVAIARAVSRANHAAFPSAADAAFARGARWLERVAGEIGTLPAVGEDASTDVLAHPYPLACSLWNLACGWGLAEGERAGPDGDPRCAWLGVRPPAPPSEPPGKTWAMWAFREGGDVVAHLRIKNRPSRVLAQMGSARRPSPMAHAAPANLVWEIGDVAVLADPGPSLGAGELARHLAGTAAHNTLTLDGAAARAPWEGRLEVARVDGRKARIAGHHLAWSRIAPLVHHRAVLLHQQRLVVTDRLVPTARRPGRHALHLCWQLGAGWVVEPDGAAFVARRGDLVLAIQLDPGLAWSLVEGRDRPSPAGWVRVGREVVPAPCFVGEGGVDGERSFTSSFEIR
ncbi:MAG: heparinase II/III domain-containing protein [Myxococcota bacterium]